MLHVKDAQRAAALQGSLTGPVFKDSAPQGELSSYLHNTPRLLGQDRGRGHPNHQSSTRERLGKGRRYAPALF